MDTNTAVEAGEGIALHLDVIPWVFGGIVLAYVGFRFVQALRRGEPAGKAIGRALLESVPSVGMLLLGVMFLGMGAALWAVAAVFYDLGEALPFAMPLFMLVFVALYPAAVGLFFAGVMMLLGGGASVTAFFAARRMGRRRGHQPVPVAATPPPPPPPPPPPVLDAPTPPAPRAVERANARPARARRAADHQPRGRRERPLRAAGR